MRIVERRAKSGIYLTTTQASVEAMALFARAGVPLDPVQIYETVELRKIHEIKAAELACARATEENFDRLREILAASEARLAAGEGLAREDRDFHLEIVRATQNSVFYQICSVYYVMGEQRLPIYFRDPERSRQSHAEHMQIFEALLRRDGNLAQALMSAHLQGAESYWKGLIGAPRHGADPALAEGLKPGRCRVVLSTHPLHPRAAAMLAGAAELRIASAPDPGTLLREGRDAEIVIVRAPLPPALFDRRAALRAAIRHGAGLDMIPVEAATAAGVLVANVPGVNARTVAEHVILVTLALLRRFRAVDRDLRAHGWQAGRAHAERTRELAGRTARHRRHGQHRAGRSATSPTTASASRSSPTPEPPRRLPPRRAPRPLDTLVATGGRRRARLPADARDDRPDRRGRGSPG